MRAADLLVKVLEKHGVTTVFGIPGAKIDGVFDALLDSSIRVILCRHEQNAAFKAAMYGRLTGKPGIVMVTSGPGVGNLVTGLLTATTEGDPVIAFGGAVPLAMKHKLSHQSADNVSLLKAATKESLELVTASSIPEVVGNAFRTAVAPMAGAVFVSLPQDIMLEETHASPSILLSQAHYGISPKTDLEAAIAILSQAKRPVLFLGQEASRPENTVAIRQFVHAHPIACVSSYQAAGVISRELFEYFAGRVGLFQNQPGDAILQQADVIITIGFNPVEYDPEIWNPNANRKIIHVDYRPAFLRQCYRPKVELVGEIKENIDALNRMIQVPLAFQNKLELKKAHDDLYQQVENATHIQSDRIHPLQFIYYLRQVVSDDDFVISDIGSHYMWLARYFFSYQPHHLLFSNGQQTLGVALPWAMATKIVHPDKNVISISGDGGFLFSATELETAVREKLSFVHFIWNDGSLNMVAEQQSMKYHRQSAVKLNSIDVMAFAKSFGAEGYRLNQASDLLEILPMAIKKKIPTIIDVPIDYSDNPKLFELLHKNIIH